jgi:hypothetical protein
MSSLSGESSLSRDNIMFNPIYNAQTDIYAHKPIGGTFLSRLFFLFMIHFNSEVVLLNSRFRDVNRHAMHVFHSFHH